MKLILLSPDLIVGGIKSNDSGSLNTHSFDQNDPVDFNGKGDSYLLSLHEGTQTCNPHVPISQ
jgi:hypothetical protein